MYDPVISREAAVAAKLLDIPAVALLAFAGPAAWADTVASKLRTERKSAAQMQSEAAECAANVAATDRINAWCGLGLKPRYCLGELEPIPKLTLVTTTRALAAPASAELLQRTPPPARARSTSARSSTWQGRCAPVGSRRVRRRRHATPRRRRRHPPL